jgi:hypothetical protein
MPRSTAYPAGARRRFYFLLYFHMANTSPNAQRPASNGATSSAKPVAVFRFENVSAAIFAESAKTKDGQTTEKYNVSVRRSYRTKDGEWEHTHTLRRGDLLPAMLGMLKCYEYISACSETEEGPKS